MDKKQNNPPKPITLKTVTGLDYFDYDEIILFRADGHNVECIVNEAATPIRVYHSLNFLENEYIDADIRRCNRSIIVNLRYIRRLEIKTKNLTLKNDMVLKVSDSFKKILMGHADNKNYKDIVKNVHHNRKHIDVSKLKIIMNKLKVNLIRKFFKNIYKVVKTLIIISLFVSSLLIISGCESPERFYRPDLPEKLCVVGIIDVDDTTLRHISFEKSFQSEFIDELNDSLRNFTFSLSSSYEEIFNFRSDSVIKCLRDLKIPDNINFLPGEKYFLYASEKDLHNISAEVEAVQVPAEPKLISANVEVTTLSEPFGCVSILDVRTAKIKLRFESDRNLYYAIVVKGWGTSLSSMFVPSPSYMDFSVMESNTPGFLSPLQGLMIPHWTCNDNSEYWLKDPAYAYFIEGNKSPGLECQLTLTIQYKDGYCLYENIKTFGIKLISIPRELYQFEKSVYAYRKMKGDPFTEPIYINGNIKGGNGIFALCRSTELKITFPNWI